jgi:hypothetical protein
MECSGIFWKDDLFSAEVRKMHEQGIGRGRREGEGVGGGGEGEGGGEGRERGEGGGRRGEGRGGSGHALNSFLASGGSNMESEKTAVSS